MAYDSANHLTFAKDLCGAFPISLFLSPFSYLNLPMPTEKTRGFIKFPQLLSSPTNKCSFTT